MGNTCTDVNFSCAESYNQHKMVKALNEKGIYPPEQIRREVEMQWVMYVPSDSDTADREQTENIVKNSINNLGANGTGV